MADYEYDPDLDYVRSPRVTPGERYGLVLNQQNFLARLMSARVRPVNTSVTAKRSQFSGAVDRGLNRIRAIPGMLSNYFTHGTGLNQLVRVASDNVRRRQGQSIPGTTPISRTKLAEQLARATGKSLQTILDELDGKIIEGAKAAAGAVGKNPAAGKVVRSASGRGDATGAVAPTVAVLSGYAGFLADRAVQHQRRLGVLGVGRRGAAATRPLSTTGTGRTNRTGSAATRKPEPLADTAASAIPGARQLSTSKSAVSSSVGQARSVLTKAAPMSWTRTAARAGQKLMQQSPFSFSFSAGLPTMPAPRRLSAPQRLSTAASPRPLTRNELSTLTQVQTATMGPPYVPTRTSTKECRCDEPERKKKSEPRCSNPLISRSEAGGVLTIKRRIVCPPSKRK